MEQAMELFHKILKAAVDAGASDIHLKSNTPVIFRIARQLVAVECPYPTVEWMNQVVTVVTPVHMKRRLEEEREIDFSYYVPGIGRFRSNLFQQRGEFCFAMRYVKIQVPSFAELGLPETIKKASKCSLSLSRIRASLTHSRGPTREESRV